ncbi:MAG: hypothetical protein SFZ02_17960 [bacterium]|nr:hypothetical protein [bacterium]
MTKKRFLIICLIALFALPFTVFAQEATPITYGQAVTGEISEATPSLSYTFTGTAGDVIVARMRATSGSGLDSFLRLLDPQGFDYYTDDDSGGMKNAFMGPITLGETGTYTLVASSCCDSTTVNSTGTFELIVEIAQVPVLALNQPAPFQLSNNSTVAFFSLLNDDISTPLARVVANIVSGGEAGNWNISVEVRGPIGNYFYSNYSPLGSTSFAVDPVIVDSDGGANIVFVRAYSNDPNLPMFAPEQVIQAELVVTEVAATPLVLDTPATGSLDDTTPTAYYSFNATMGEILNLRGEQATDAHPISITVYAPGGFSMNGASTIDYMDGSNLGGFVIDPLRAMNTGTYYVVVNRASYGSPEEVFGKVSPFTLTLGATATPILEVGVPVTGIFDNPDVYEAVYRYQATANQTIRITLKSLNGGYAPAFDIQGEAFESPDVSIANVNSAAPGTYIYEVTLYYDSVYIIRVRNGIYFPMEGTPGEYSLQIDVVQ